MDDADVRSLKELLLDLESRSLVWLSFSTKLGGVGGDFGAAEDEIWNTGSGCTDVSDSISGEDIRIVPSRGCKKQTRGSTDEMSKNE